MQMQKFVIFVTKYLKINMLQSKKYHKVKDHCYYTGGYRSAAHNICNLKYSIPKKIPIDSHNGSSYDYHFIIKELEDELEKQFTSSGKSTEKCINFSVPTQNVVAKRIDKNWEEIS